MYASQNRWHELYAELRANFKEQLQKKKVLQSKNTKTVNMVYIPRPVHFKEETKI